MLINKNKRDEQKNISLGKLKNWFSESYIFFPDEQEEQNLKFRSPKGEILFSFELTEYTSKESSPAYILTLNSHTNVYKPKIFLYNDFVNELKKFLNINHCESVFLNRELSKYYSNELYSIFNEFEVTLRRLMHLVFFKNYGHHWEEKLFDKSIVSELKKKIQETKSDHIIEEMNLSAIESLLFKEIVIESKKDSVATFELMQNIGSYDNPKYVVSPEFILNANGGSFRTFSLWEEVFSKHISSEFQGPVFEEKFKKMREIRNKVAHNKKVKHSDFTFIKSFLNKFTKEMMLISVEKKYSSIPELSTSLASAIQNFMSPISETLKYLDTLSLNPKIVELSKSFSNFGMDPKIVELSKSLSNFGVNSKMLELSKSFPNLGVNPKLLEFSKSLNLNVDPTLLDSSKSLANNKTSDKSVEKDDSD